MSKTKTKTRKIKTFNGGEWIYNSEKARTFEEADVVILPGGGDWNPALYGHKAIPATYFNDDVDSRQMGLIDRAVDAGKLLFGICRGLQGVTIKAGGYLIQDISHPSYHEVRTKDGDSYGMNSCHHQLCYPYELPRNEYDVLSWTEELSNHHIIQGNKQLEYPEIALDDKGYFKEPEVIWYPKIRALGTQGHPEWGPGKKALDFINNLIREKLGLK